MTTQTRPPLPTRHANPNIPETLKSGVLPPVKYQILNCQGQDILVGRLKIETPTPSGHAFILRRFDTGAISLTTMFRAAFPNAPEQEEKLELQWVRENFDLTGNNGSTTDRSVTRLAGTWVSPDLALDFGIDYALGALIQVVIDATPDPNGNYRRSGKAATNSSAASPAAVPTATNVSAAINTVSNQATARPQLNSSPNGAPGPAKRRRESSPAPSPTVAPPSPVKPSSKPLSSVNQTPIPRRSARTKSPAPRLAAGITPFTATKSIARTPVVTRIVHREEAFTPRGSDETAVEDAEDPVEEVATSELRQQDILEQKQMIEDLKAQRDAAAAKRASSIQSAEEEEAEEGEEEDDSANLKRAREEETQELKFNFREPEVGERNIASNSRVGRFQMEPRTKSFAWGMAAFAVGMGAISLLPNLF
ncbi:hypothetical protein BD779DRAFT_1618471 [Infundibulicybe gibba]|nr:hypothetical protein BD779DRAFT_1618471 [Infundibulicybe gibba]